VFLRNNAKVEGGVVSLKGAQISDEFNVRHAQFQGEVTLRGAKIGGDLDLSGAQLVNSDGYALSAGRCQIGGTLYFRLATRAVGKIDLAYAQVGALDDKLASWPETFNLEGCSYRALAAENRDPSQRLKWLSGSESFSPDIYNQLAGVYRRSGEEGHAQKVAIEREERRAKEPDLSWGVKVWRRFLGFTVAYGYKPGQALWLFMALLLVGYTLLNRQPSGP
jgi:autotransporter translocation and assembly factor TamB